MTVSGVAVLMVAGFQVPLMPLVEVVGRAGALAFWHKGPISANCGVVSALMVMESAAIAAHCPAFGVKV